MDWESIAFYAIATFGLALLGALSKYLAPMLHKLIDAKVGNKKVARVLHLAWDAIWTAVKNTGQTFVEDIKAGRSDGKLTDGEKQQALHKARDMAKRQLGEQGVNLVKEVLGIESDGDLDDWLDAKIEAAVGDSKRDPSPPSP